MPCDFCDAEAPGYWHFAIEGFFFVYKEGSLNIPTVVETGFWGACDHCAPLILAKDVDGLVARVECSARSRNYVKYLHTLVLAHITKRTPTWSVKVPYSGEKKNEAR